MNNQSDMRSTASILAAGALEEDRASLANIFQHTNWGVHYVRGRQEAMEFLREHRLPVLICHCDLPDGNWKELLDDIAGLAAPPLLIVSSRLPDDHLWAEVLNVGGYTVLAKPFDQAEVIWEVSLAWRHWRDASRQVRRAS